MFNIPKEVYDRAKRYFGGFGTLTRPFYPSRLVYYPKSEVDKCTAWIRAVKTGIGKFKNEKHGNGWRKCHTENYWCYYAKEMADDKCLCKTDLLMNLGCQCGGK